MWSLFIRMLDYAIMYVYEYVEKENGPHECDPGMLGLAQWMLFCVILLY